MWKQTGIGFEIDAHGLPSPDQLRLIGIEPMTLTFVRAGDFDGWVYTCDAGGTTLRWWQYAGELDEEQ